MLLLPCWTRCTPSFVLPVGVRQAGHCYFPAGRGLHLPSNCQAERAELEWMLLLPYWTKSTPSSVPPGGGLPGSTCCCLLLWCVLLAISRMPCFVAVSGAMLPTVFDLGRNKSGMETVLTAFRRAGWPGGS